MKVILYLVVVFLANFQIAFSQNVDWLDVSQTELKNLRDSFYENSKADLLFLIDTSGSLSGYDFTEEKKFVTNLLNEIRVASEGTRVEVIPFATTSDRFIRQISEPHPSKNKCTFNEKFVPMGRDWGYLTNTKEAMRLAEEVCIGEWSGQKRGTLSTLQTTVILITDGRWNYPWGASSPVSFAQEIRNAGGEIFAIGVGNIDYSKLQQVVRDPNKQAFHLANFDQFTQLATYLRGDPFERLWETQDVDSSKCKGNCDSKAQCACGLVYGDYKCACKAGYYGTGETGKCFKCPPSTYKYYQGHEEACTACPKFSGHNYENSTTIQDCKCHTGYSGTPENGNDCEIRSCLPMLPPQNGSINGVSCNNTYLSNCSFACDEGYELNGDQTRTCTVQANDIMDWSGTPVQCIAIVCPAQSVDFAGPPAGSCTNAALNYRTECTFTCDNGYQRSGAEKNTCQLDKSWTPDAPTCNAITCDPLPTVAGGTYNPASCDVNATKFDLSCTLTCPDGYYISYGSTVKNVKSDTRVCYTNGSWTYEPGSPACIDVRPPELSCPPSQSTASNDPGTNVSTTSWDFSFTDNSLGASFPGITKNDSFTVTLTINEENVNTDLPKLLAIGKNTMTYNVTDAAGNRDSCTFIITVLDEEAPVCVNCPADITYDNLTDSTQRVNWGRPVCTDNSGEPPEVTSTRPLGDIFAVPGAYEIVYTAKDKAGNQDRNCSFRITLSKKTCIMYDPPANGALSCQNFGSDPACTIACQRGFDFITPPPFLYLCTAGTWQMVGFGVFTVPWPDCAATANPYQVSMGHFPQFYFDGNCTDPNTQTTIKSNFVTLLSSLNLCTDPNTGAPRCNQDEVTVYCGSTSAAARRRRRSTVRQVSVKYVYVFPDITLPEGTNDQAGQDNFNAAKATADQTRTTVYNDLQAYDWNAYQASTGLELQDGNVDNYNLGQVEAYCSENGAVVRKCNDADLNCGKESCPCTKTEGTVTKCTRCPVGTYYDSDEDDCLLCAEGTYSPTPGALQCTACPEGTWTVGTRGDNFTSCIDNCGPGYYSATGVAKCFKCPMGTYSADVRNKACTSCPSGTVTVIDAAQGIQDCGMQCAPGTYSSNGVEPCLPCPVGTYQPGTGQVGCLPCPGVQSTHGTGASSDAFCEAVDTCVSNPCINGGTCVNTKESYRCTCPPGYNGVNCQNEIDECLSSPCYRSSTCVNKVNAHKCLCSPEYTGNECQLPYSLCTQRQPCATGVCIDKAGTYVCQCPTGYSGTFCEYNNNECASNPCQNNGICVGGLDTYSCWCQPGYTGVNCQIDIDDCAAEPCNNGGTCVDGLQSYTCQCPDGYTGVNCEHAINRCVGQPCKNGGTCVNTLTGYKCLCKPTYYGCRCTKVLSSAYDLSFQVREVKSYSKIKKPIPDLTAVTVAFWMRTMDTKSGTVISYATTVGNIVQDNAMALQDYSSFVLFINNQTDFTGVRANDGQWHHIAVTWESASGTWHAYKDGVKTASSSAAFQKDEVITGNGVLILGQEQDTLGGGFNTEENFMGDISQMNVFDYVLSENDIYNLAYSCDYVKGNVAAWADFQEQLFGQYHVTDSSYACDFSAAQREFYVTYNSYISGSPDKELSNSNPESCASACRSEDSFLCRSFDFDNSSNTCRMSTRSTRDSALTSLTGRRYFEFNCLRSLEIATSRGVPDADMTASSEYDATAVASGGRLNFQAQYSDEGVLEQIGGWAAQTADISQYLQVKFSQILQISGVATQGRADDAYWVTSYKLEYSTDGLTWTYYPDTLDGNSDQNTTVRHQVKVFQAMYLRFRPQTWNADLISMRVEAYGCPLTISTPADSTDECSSAPCQNGANCVNRYNDYLCACPNGYSGKNCQTAEACKAIGAPIYGTISSSNYNAGSTLSFTCNAGYSLYGSSSRTCQGGSWTGSHPQCQDTNECNSNPCNQWCLNTNGGYLCHCHKGYVLQGSNTCVDIDECSNSNGGCSHTCHNSAGSFSCSCPSGMEMDAGGRSCKDIDECSSSNGGCEHTCVNTDQSFYCICRQGYTLKADQKTCEVNSCPSLSAPSNGQVSLSSGLMKGSTATYTCNNGYKATYSDTRYCQTDGEWSGGGPSCIRVFCEDIGQVEHATRVLTGTDGGNSVLGTTATFTCDANYQMTGDGDASRTCQVDGSWSGTQPRCVSAFCSPVPVPTNGAVQGYRYELNATLRITCDEGYEVVPSSSSFRTCTSDGAGGGTWSGQDPVCELVDCGDPGDPYGGNRHIASDTKYQSVVTYTCQAQHHLEGEDSQVCQADGQWSGSKPICLERSCGNPGVPTNGKKNSSSYQYGNSILFECDVGYTLQGSSVRTCQNNGLWTGTQPTCQIVSCGDPGTPTNGVQYGETYTYQSLVVLECDPGYKLVGDAARICQSDGSWTGTQPTCTETSCGQYLNGPSGILNSSNYPANYNNDEYCTWQIQVPVDKKIRLDFHEFQTETGKDYLLIYDTNHYDKVSIAFDGTTYKPPSFTSSGNVIRVRFISDGATSFKGFSFSFKQVDTSCGGVYEDGTGTISSPNFPNGYAPNLDCVWLVYRTTETAEFVFSEFGTESNYDTVKITSGRFGETVQTNGWSGHIIPTGSFTTDSYLWIKFTTNGNDDSNSRFNEGWSGKYQRYWPYVSGKKKRK